MNDEAAFCEKGKNDTWIQPVFVLYSILLLFTFG